MYLLGLDIGTTCIKTQVFNDEGKIVFYKAQEYGFKTVGGFNYIDIEKIVRIVKNMLKDASKCYPLDSLSFSSLGEAFVLLDCNDNILSLPMLYTDLRGEEEAKSAGEKLGMEKIFEISGTTAQAMYSVYKLLWLKKNAPIAYAKADKLLLLVDYIGYILTGKRVIDHSLAARTGIFDIKAKIFSKYLLKQLGINEGLFSRPEKAGSLVGLIKEEIALELGLKKDCVVVLGSHDQICATLGAGIISDGQAADGMGTTECITSVFKTLPASFDMAQKGYPIVPYAADGLYCTYILNFNNCSVTNWLTDKIMHGFKDNKKSIYEYLEANFDFDKEPSDILMLPYFSGSANPYCDTAAKGAFLNLTLGTTDADLYRSILEGTSFEMKLNLEIIEKHGIKVNSLIATGGGSKSDMWLKIKADITGLTVTNLLSNEGGLSGLAMLSAVAMGMCKDLQDAKKMFVSYDKVFLPNKGLEKRYYQKYTKYKTIYHKLKELV